MFKMWEKRCRNHPKGPHCYKKLLNDQHAKKLLNDS